MGKWKNYIDEKNTGLGIINSQFYTSTTSLWISALSGIYFHKMWITSFRFISIASKQTVPILKCKVYFWQSCGFIQQFCWYRLHFFVECPSAGGSFGSNLHWSCRVPELLFLGRTLPIQVLYIRMPLLLPERKAGTAWPPKAKLQAVIISFLCYWLKQSV